MADESFLKWPFFDEAHRHLTTLLRQWSANNLNSIDYNDVDAACRLLVTELGNSGWLNHSAIDPNQSGGRLDVRTLCLIRETLAYHDGLADFAFAMQGLGTGAISLFGTQDQKKILLDTRSGKLICAFALSEQKSGSDVANIEASAKRNGTDYILTGEKTWISNGGIADIYVVFVRTGEAPGSRGLSAFLLPAGSHGLEIAERLDVIAPHPLARIRFNRIKLPANAMIGQPGAGF